MTKDKAKEQLLNTLGLHTSDSCFTEHTTIELTDAITWLKETHLPIECFNAFLYNYKKTGDLVSAILFARSEWDC